MVREEQSLSAEMGRRLRGRQLKRRWITLAEIRQRLAPKSVLVEFVKFDYQDERDRYRRWKLYMPKGWQPGIGKLFLAKAAGSHYAAWIIPAAGKGKVRFVLLGWGTPIDAAIRQYHIQIRIAMTPREKAFEKFVKASEELSRLLLKDLYKPLASYQRWILSPDAGLWVVPFASLQPNEDKYVVESHELSYLTSSRTLLDKGGTATKAKGAFIFENPDYNHGLSSKSIQYGFFPLPGTAIEAKAVTPQLSLYIGKTPQVFLEEKATEKQVKSVISPRVLLLSTHGYFSRPSTWKNPLLRTGLAFAGANRVLSTPTTGSKTSSKGPRRSADDGILTGLEVVGMQLSGTELVVLSACETGRGDLIRGEGVAGLRQAFHLAGSRSVIASRWSVVDGFTARLMTEFFKQLASGKRASEALRLSQLKILNRQPNSGGAIHPVYWAAFSISGAPK